MAVYLFLIIFAFALNSYAVEKKIRENWNKLSYPQQTYQLYKLLNFQCLWLCNEKETENFHILQRIFKEATHHGIEIKTKNIDKELAITDSLIDLAYSLYYGRTEPAFLYNGWNLPRKPDMVVRKLAMLIKENRLENLIEEFSPENEEYWFLVEEGKHLKEISSINWKPIKLKRPLSLGDISPCIDEIRFRLFLLGDLEYYEPSDVFDNQLLEAVKSFQRRHGLPEKGSIGSKTLEELNIPPAERLKSIYMNLEKHRWVHIPFKRYILVNIPSFELFLIEDGQVKLSSKVIVGRNYKDDFRPTPMLYSKVESITINPKWYVPVSIAVKDLLPKIKKNPSYLTKKGFKVLSMGREIDPLRVDWSMYNEKNFPFMLVQEAGPQNALGHIKFNFPNPFQVYLHDTPDRHLFKHTKRAFSSGCIRVDKARELALSLLGGDWTGRQLAEMIKSRKTQTIKLKEPIPIYILYYTAFERDGKLHFREDLYGYDTILSQNLFFGGKP
ncbi:MAG: murein L,D-transpeptidase [Aquificaceae bacterium]